MLEESVTSLPSIWAAMNSWLTPTVLFVLLNLMIGTIAITSSLATPKPHDQPNSEKQPHQPQPQPQACHHPQLVRSPSMLQRLKSINFYTYRSQEPTTFTFEKPQDFDSSYLQNHPQEPQQEHQEPEQEKQPPLSRSPSTLQRLKSNLYTYLSPDPTVNNVQNQGQKGQKDEKIQDQENDQEQSLEEIYSKLQGNNKVSRSVSDTKPSSGEVLTKLPKKMKKSASTKSAFAHFEEDDIVAEKRRPATVRERKAKVTEEDDAEVDAKADDFINRFKQQLKLQRIDSIMRYKDMVSSRGSEK